MQNCYICERLGYCDVELRGTRLHGDGGNGWTELNGCMMALELPGIYIRPEKNLFYAFDHVDVKMLKSNQQEMLLSITNTTPFDAEGNSTFIECSFCRLEKNKGKSRKDNRVSDKK